MKTFQVIYKNKAKIIVSPIPKRELKKINIPKCDTIKLSIIGNPKENSESFYMAPDEILDLAMVCIEYLANNQIIKRRIKK